MRCFRPRAEPVVLAEKPQPQAVVRAVYCVAEDDGAPYSPPSAPPAPPPPQPAPFEETEYQQLSRKLMHMLQNMRSIGAHHALELPLLVVCGNQSAGKSSLIEALCGVPLPRSDGTCTRCPLEVRMSSAPTLVDGAPAALPAPAHAGGRSAPRGDDADRPGWVCTIKLRREYDAHGRRLAVPEEALFQGNLSSRRDVERNLRGAQERLLSLDAPAVPGAPANHLTFAPATNRASPGGAAAAEAAAGRLMAGHHSRAPSMAQQAGLDGSPGKPAALGGGGGAGRGSAGFSRNVVVLEISGAAVDLVLVDLPGIIHSVEQASDVHFRDVVLELVRSYICRDSAVIVPVISCKEDIDTQGILSLAREFDPQGARTVGVLTKPDQIEPACHRQWLDVLQGRRYPLALGYYMVRNPSQQQLMQGVGSDSARRAESSFFSSTPPWAAMAHQEGGRLGAHSLRSSLSRVLVELTRQAIPALQAEAVRKLQEVEAQLERLPPPPPDAADDPRRALLVMADVAAAAVRRQLLAGGAEKGFYQRLLLLSREFKATVYASKPRYIVANAQHQDLAGYAFTCITDGDQEQPYDPEHTGGPGPRARSTAVLALVAVAGRGGNAPSVLRTATQPPSRGPAAGAALALEDVRVVIEQHRGLELPGFSPYSAVQALIARSAAGWSDAADTLVEQVVESLGTLVAQAIADTFGRFPEAYRLARSKVQGLVQALRVSSAASVRGLIIMEQTNAFTMNRADFEGTSADVLQQLREAYHTRHTAAAVLAAATAARAAGGSKAGIPPLSGARGPRVSNGLSSALRRSISGGGIDDGLPDERPIGGGAPAGGGANWLSHDVSDEQILGMMAVSLTYFVVSSRRLVDYVPLHVMHYLVGRLADQLKGVLVDALLAGASEGGRGVAGEFAGGRDGGARWLLHEESGAATRRAELRAQRALLEGVLASLRC